MRVSAPYVPTFNAGELAPWLTVCPACGSDTGRVSQVQPAYRDDGQTYGIYRCWSCGSSSAWPRVVPGDLYDVIHAQAARIPGYARHEGYATLVSQSAAPLEALADAEDVYWGIAAALDGMGGPGKVKRVLDVGCGLGCLTFALSRAGYEARGLDVSTQAIAAARSRFGELFSVGTAAELARTSPQAWSAVILAEVLEHVADPREVLADVWRLVAPGGALVVTTPNRTFYSPRVLWHTDPPPVHLSWFSEAGLRRLGDALGAETALIDFTAYSAARPTWRVRAPWLRITRGSMLAADGTPLQTPGPRSSPRRREPGLPGGSALFALLQFLSGHRLVRGRRRETMVAVLRRPR